MIIFLDFDGVLRREGSPPLAFQADCLEHFESSIRSFPDVKIVVSSTWRVGFSLNEIRGFFSADVAGRIVGKTPELEYEKRHARFAEIQQYLKTSERPSEPWIAVDDSQDLFPPEAPLLLTQSKLGFDGECVLRIRQMILAICNDEE